MVRFAAPDLHAFAQPWLLDATGEPTPDPAVMFADPPGTILPLGGLDAGHRTTASRC